MIVLEVTVFLALVLGAVFCLRLLFRYLDRRNSEREAAERVLWDAMLARDHVKIEGWLLMHGHKVDKRLKDSVEQFRDHLVTE